MQKRHTHIKWSLVDLTRPASELAEELGVTVATIYRKRKELGIVVPNMSGGKIGNKGGARPGNQNRAGKYKEDAHVQYQIRIKPSLLEQVKSYAKRRSLPVSEVFRLALVAYLNAEHQHGAEEEKESLNP